MQSASYAIGIGRDLHTIQAGVLCRKRQIRSYVTELDLSDTRVWAQLAKRRGATDDSMSGDYGSSPDLQQDSPSARLATQLHARHIGPDRIRHPHRSLRSLLSAL